MAQLMPLPLTVSCFSKIQIDFTFLVLAYPEKGPSNGCVCLQYVLELHELMQRKMVTIFCGKLLALVT